MMSKKEGGKCISTKTRLIVTSTQSESNHPMLNGG